LSRQPFPEGTSGDEFKNPDYANGCCKYRRERQERRQFLDVYQLVPRVRNVGPTTVDSAELVAAYELIKLRRKHRIGVDVRPALVEQFCGQFQPRGETPLTHLDPTRAQPDIRQDANGD
jgi:hypothetical protein